MKTYTNSEVIKMLEENPLLEFECIQNGKTYNLFCDTSNNIKILSDSGIDCGFKIGDKWTLVQKPVDFMTASNSGKEIKPVSLDKEKSFHKFTYWLGFMVSSLAYKDIKPLDLINGKWYIKED